MISMTTQARGRPRPAALRTWRTATGLAGVAGGALLIVGAFQPWVETFAGLISIPGVRGAYGQAMVALGVVVAAAGLYQLLRGGGWSRWLTALAGFGALGFAGYLLIQLAATMRSLSGNSMVVAQGGPGLWFCAAGGLVAFGSLFLPVSAAAGSAPGQPGALRARAGAAWRRTLDWTADLESAGVRRGLQIGLGVVWLLDAALQFQPYMFGRAFAAQVLAPTAAGSPAAVASPVLWASHLVEHSPAVWNSLFALAQLAIAVGLLWRPMVKAALAGSIVWSLAVWWLGEGLGGLLTGTASPVTGAPGAVILYALIALAVWPRRAPAGGGVAVASPLGTWARAAWAVLWLAFAYLILQGPVRAPGALRDAIAGGAAGEPGWLASLDRSAASAVGAHGLAVSIVLAVLFAAVAAGVFVPALTRPALAVAVLLGLAIWVVGENFGMIFMGNATDPNSGPLLILLAAAFWPLRPPAGRPHDLAAADATAVLAQPGDAG